MDSMFSTADAFNQPIGDWDVSSVTNLAECLVNSFNQPIGDWDVSNVTDMLVCLLMLCFQPTYWQLGCE